MRQRDSLIFVPGGEKKGGGVITSDGSQYIAHSSKNAAQPAVEGTD